MEAGQKTEQALKKMEESDLNQEIWGPFFRAIITNSCGGAECASLEIRDDDLMGLLNPHDIVMVTNHYLGKFGLNTNIQLSINNGKSWIIYHKKECRKNSCKGES